MDKQKPIRDFKAGAVLASVWPREGANGPFYQVTLQRMYKRDDDSKWEYSDSFGERDLASVSQAASDAYNWIAANPAGIPAEEQAA